jgi:hypothetical protein
VRGRNLWEINSGLVKDLEYICWDFAFFLFFFGSTVLSFDREGFLVMIECEGAFSTLERRGSG